MVLTLRILSHTAHKKGATFVEVYIYILSFVYDTLELFALLASGLVTITQQGLRIEVKENNISSLFKSCVRINLVVFSSILILGDFYQMSRTG
jgi:hypothetical protein